MDGNFSTTPQSTYKFNKVTSAEYGTRVILAVIAIIVTILGLCGNSLVILSVILSKKLQTATNVFVTNLAVADLLTCFVIPWNVVALLSKTGWPIAEWICVLAAFTLFLCIGSSVWNLASIAINRLLVITLTGNKFQQIYTRRNIIVMLTLTWLVPTLAIGVPILIGNAKLGYDEEHGTCSDTSRGMTTRVAHVLVQALVLLFLPMSVILVCYIKILVHVRAHTRLMMSRHTESVRNTPVLRQKVKTRNKQRIFRVQIEITKNSFYIVCAFLICVTPFAITLAVYQEGSRYASIVLLASTVINPLIYAIKHPHFKIVFYKIVKCDWQSIPGRPEFLRSLRSNDRHLSVSIRTSINGQLPGIRPTPSSSTDDIL